MISKLDIHFIELAVGKALQSGCVSTKVGAVLVQNKKIVCMNNNQSLYDSCSSACCHMLNDKGELKTDDRPDHSKWSDKNEVHAEMMCFMDAHQRGFVLKGATLYTTASPCDQCSKHIEFYGKTKAVTRVVYLDKYDRGPSDWIDRLTRHGVVVEKVERNQLTFPLPNVKLTNVETKND